MTSRVRRAAAAASGRSRAAKIRYLLRAIPPDASVLLVGVAAGGGIATVNEVEGAVASGRPAVALCYEQPRRDPLPGAPTVRADARALPFRDKSFDYVVSNAVIEHLGGVEGARRLIDESDRVARVGWFHTTPNRRFPVETHTLVIGLHWLPRRWQSATFRRIGRRFPPSRYWLFTGRTLRGLSGDVRVVSVGRSPLPMTLIASNLDT